MSRGAFGIFRERPSLTMRRILRRGMNHPLLP